MFTEDSPHDLNHVPHLDWEIQLGKKTPEAVLRTCIWINPGEKSTE